MQTHAVADKASLSDLRRSIRGDLARAGAEPAVTFDCLVAVTEACTQVLLRQEDGPEAAISWTIVPGAATFFIQQTGSLERCRASHPSGRRGPAPSPVDALIDDLAEDLPLALMNQLMDRVSVEEGPRGRRTTLMKLL